MATTFRTPETTTTETRRSTDSADSLVADRQAERSVAPHADRPTVGPAAGTHDHFVDIRPIAPARYPGRRLDRFRRTDAAAPSPRDLVLAEADPTFTVRSIQR